MNKIIDPITMENLKTDIFQFGMALILSHIASGRGLFEDNAHNMKAILVTLIGFAVYQVAVARVWLDKVMPGSARVAIDDTLKFTCALFIGKLLLDPYGIFTLDFTATTFHILVSFLAYNGIIAKYVTSKMIKDNMSLKEIMALNDTFKYLFSLFLAGILNTLSGVRFMTGEYLRLTLGYTTGIVLYDLLFA